jgi:hypothetical protein
MQNFEACSPTPPRKRPPDRFSITNAGADAQCVRAAHTFWDEPHYLRKSSMVDSEASVELANLPLPERLTVVAFMLRNRFEAMRIVLGQFIASTCENQDWRPILARTLQGVTEQIARETFGQVKAEDITSMRQVVGAEALEFLTAVRTTLLHREAAPSTTVH